MKKKKSNSDNYCGGQPNYKYWDKLPLEVKKEIMKQFEDAIFPERENYEEDKEPSWKMAKVMSNDFDDYFFQKCSDMFGDFGPLATPAELDAAMLFYSSNPVMIAMDERNERSIFFDGTGLKSLTNGDAWIQTHSGRRFSPTNPDHNAIVLQDIAHSLSMQCRFSGHSKKFYSVGQHSVLVSYICDSSDALWGLLHDASEAYCVDVPRPLKRSGLLQGYIDIENRVQEAVCRRFGLAYKEPPSVKIADTQLLATEARDLISPLHPDWTQPVEALPFIIEPWGPEKTKDMFIKRFFELTKAPASHFEYYLKHKDQL